MSIKKFIPQMEPNYGEEEVSAMQRYLMSGGWLTEFEKTEEFERLLCEFTGSKYCVATNNGTISLTLALLALGVKPGDEVIVPDLTMIATPNSAKLIGAEPKFVDVEKETLCIDIDRAEEIITSKTKCLIHVSFNGRTNDLHKVKKFCMNHNLYLIEDAAQSLGSYYNGNHLGTIGDIGSLSFSSPKIITTGQGGALLTNDKAMFKDIRKLKDFGREIGGNDIHDSIGYNFKYTDMQAVIGIEQMKKLKKRADRKKEIYKLYYNELKDVGDIKFIKTDLEATTPWFIDIFVENPDKLAFYLKNNNIGKRRIYPPINTQKAYNAKGNFPVTEHYSNRGLWLPSSSKLTNEEIIEICAIIKEYYKK